MFVSTPDRSRPLLSLDRLEKPAAHQANFLLPPLSAMLGNETSSPPRPALPAASSFATPQTPRYVLPSIRSTSTPALTTLPELAGRTPPVLATTKILDAVSPREPAAFSAPRPSVGVSTLRPTASVSTPNVSLAKVSTPKAADAKTGSKRKHSTTLPSRDFAFISHSPATYPSQEPSIDNASLARRKRRRTSPVELAVLNDEFKLGLTPDKARRIAIAARVSMSEKAVQIWFQNKRQLLRRLRNTDKEVTELPPAPEFAAVPTPPAPFYASTPLRPALAKAETSPFPHTPGFSVVSPVRAASAADLTAACLAGPVQPPSTPHDAGARVSLYSRMLATASDERSDKRASSGLPELVMNLTNKKQPGFARQSAQAATQVMTFKLTPKDRKPLATLSTNTPSHQRIPNAKDSQCIQGLLSLKVGHL
ncbi:homeobox-domain-containing protein [Metschnikowia bicuspidata var. bicuspidata NRRL YB-4993]|uniref:Homeobox-domain-containing protein n=1 Tax=Metschnikowia bicuspidata var. bicuspidata NRRL YB-4993 TaxID=869754 RepID=A0A1A0HI73_9ASCO|nr:homeobox-domain-containing protein [Metschnikowia bicuspidata var. bicuspidata NRRL YB-4993]OBA23705.1 homeobox-domain-containing protein [Metschnikowia bicuspidata var. bicuspidata NRRL YB-4993]